MSRKLISVVHDFPNPSQTFVERQIVAAIDLGYQVSVLVRKKSDLGQSSLLALNEQYGLLDKTVKFTWLYHLPQIKGVLKSFIKSLVGIGQLI